MLILFQSTRLSRASTYYVAGFHQQDRNFNPQGSREPRRNYRKNTTSEWTFQSTRLSRASTACLTAAEDASQFQSTRLSRASTPGCYTLATEKGFQSTRLSRASTSVKQVETFQTIDFNPQGSREPRRQKCTIILASMPHLHASYYTSSTNRLSSWNFLA